MGGSVPLFESSRPAAGDQMRSPGTGWDALVASASRRQVEALSKSVPLILSHFGVEGARCGQDHVDELAATRRDLTVVVDSRRALDAAIAFGFDTNVAEAVAAKMAAFMFGDALPPGAGEQDEFVRGTLGEMASFTLLATLNALSLPPEIAVPRLLRGRGVGLAAGTRAASSFLVATELGDIEVSLAPALEASGSPRLERDRDHDGAESRRRVVVADDSTMMRRVIQRTLTQAGYKVVAHARDGREAVEEFRRHRPDVLVLDSSMPVIGALDVMKIIRAEDPTARVLICSAAGETGAIPQLEPSDTVSRVTKPFDAAELVRAIEDLLREEGARAHAVRRDGTSPIGVPSLGVYRVTRVIASGGMADVYEGYDPGLSRKVALKVIRERYSADVDLVVRFLEEARSVARISHPNVVSIYSTGSDRHKHFFAMEFLPGPDLSGLVDRLGPLPSKEALSYVRQGALGLAAARHEGLVHCDVKPSNLVFGSDGLVRVTDFGIVQHVDAEETATGSEVYGTASFMAPEQVTGEHVDHRTDIYALGATLYFLLTGEPPYDGDDALEVALRQVHEPVPAPSMVPRQVRKLLARMMAKDRADRHADYDELLRDIDRLL
jgi:CheY-like chemotaxis protein/tRNA A-37 threonylcarbamoyl transferase component Bud32